MAELLKVADCYKYPMPWVLSSKKGGEFADVSSAWVEDYEVLRDYLRYSVNDTINLLQQHQDRIEQLESQYQLVLSSMETFQEKFLELEGKINAGTGTTIQG